MFYIRKNILKILCVPQLKNVQMNLLDETKFLTNTGSMLNKLISIYQVLLVSKKMTRMIA